MKGVAATGRVHRVYSERWLMKHAILGERPAPARPIGHDELRSRLFCQTMQHPLCDFFASECTCDTYRQNAVCT